MTNEQRQYATEAVEKLHASTRTFVENLLMLAVILLLGWAALNEPIIPNEEDCEARGKAADCWREVTP